MADIFDEVSEDLRADRARQYLQKYGFLLILAAILVVAGVAGWQAWHWRTLQQREAVATQFIAAMRDSSPTADAAARTQAVDQFSRVATEAPEGYRTLARLRAAGLKVAAGDLPGALALWDQVSADTSADPQLRELADLLWVQHQVDNGDPAAVQGRLAPLVAPGNAWRALALESQAMLLLRTGQTDQARGILHQLAGDPAAPAGVRARAGGVLSRFGEAPDQPAAPGTIGG